MVTTQQPGRPPLSLARSSLDDVAEAHQLAVRLVATAQHLTRATSHLYLEGPFIGDEPCRGNRCTLGDRRSGAVMCSLAHRLALLAMDTSDVPPAVDLPGAFIDALRDSFEAVRTCRQTLHPTGMCWFARADSEDGCGEILQAAHAIVD